MLIVIVNYYNFKAIKCLQQIKHKGYYKTYIECKQALHMARTFYVE